MTAYIFWPLADKISCNNRKSIYDGLGSKISNLEVEWVYTGKTELNSCRAIEWAMTEGNTTKTGNQPGGLGLKLIKDFIQMNGGKIQVVSRFGYYEFSANGETIQKMNSDFPGTCINIEINTEDRSSYCLKSELKSEDIF